MSNSITIQEEFENRTFYDENGVVSSTQDGSAPFYLEGSTGTLDCGYGYNVNANGTSAIQNALNLTQSELEMLDEVLNNTATVKQLNDMIMADRSDGFSYQDAAKSLEQSALNSELADLDLRLARNDINIEDLSSGALDALQDREYNIGPRSDASFGQNLLNDLAAGNYGAAAYELAGNTATKSNSNQNGYESREPRKL